MPSSPAKSPAAAPAVPPQQATLDALVGAAVGQVKEQLGAVAGRFAAALIDVGQPGLEAKEVYCRVKSGKLLKENSYAFLHLATTAIEGALRQEVAQLAPAAAARVTPDALSLVPLTEIDTKLAFAALARPFDIAHSDALAMLAVRLGMLLGRGVLRFDANPFRPEIFLRAVDEAWREFEPDSEAHGLVLELLRPEMLFDLGPLYEALGAALVRKQGQPDSVESYRIQKTDDSAAAKAARAAGRAALAEQLRKLFGDDGGEDGVPLIPDLPSPADGGGGWRPSAAAGFQAAASAPAVAGAAPAGPVPAAGLAQLAPGFAAGQLATPQPAPGFAASQIGTSQHASGFAASHAGPTQPASGFVPAPSGVTGAASGFAAPDQGAPHTTAGYAPALMSAHAPAQLHAGTDGAPATAYAPAHPGAPVSAGAHGALHAILSGLQPGVVAPLLDLLARIDPAQERATLRGADGADGAVAGIGASPGSLDAAPVGDVSSAGGAAIAPNLFYLPRLKQSLPKGSLSRGDERTLDLLSRVFETVLLDDSIPPGTRELLQALQVPVLKAALLDRNFFFEEAHPARRLVDLMSRMGWEQRADADDPMFAAMRRSVAKVSEAGAAGAAAGGFEAAVAELEASIAAEDDALESAIAAPVASAIRQENMAVATRAAREAVALRVKAGDLLDVVSGFLEQRWSTVLTFAYSIETQKPGAVGNATRAMDDLIWSVRPKPTQEQRKTLIARLPRLLSTLNKWLDAIKWQDADRLEFFARLAEYHAAIVRAPIELSPERQLELAVEAAQQDALRRVELESAAAERATAEQRALSPLDGLERGMWLEFRQAEGARKVKLAWVSPLRTLFIFSGAGRREAFSLTAERLVEALHAGSARVLAIDGVVGQVLSEAMGQGAVNDASMLASASRAAAG